MEICERHGRIRCDECSYVEELKERLERVRAIVRVIEEDIDPTTLTQLQLALDGELEGKEEGQNGHWYHAVDDEYGVPMYDRDGPVMRWCDDPQCPENRSVKKGDV